MPNIDRFWRLINKTETCWLWTGATNKGYGKVHNTYAHRRTYTLLVGPIPTGLELDHLCGTPLCVNPDHLEPVTREENMRRRSEATTHCINGHEFTPENTYDITKIRRPSGGRKTCRACNRAAVARYRLRRAS